MDLSEVLWADGGDAPSRIAMRMSARTSVSLLPLGLDGDRLYFVVAAGSIAAGRFKPRAGPLYRALRTRVEIEPVGEWAELPDDAYLDVDLIEAAASVAAS